MRRLLDHFEAVFDLDYRVGGERLGGLVEGVLDGVRTEAMPEFGAAGDASRVEARSSRFVRFYYRPHLFPEMDVELRLAHQLQFHLLPRSVPREAPVSIAAVLESYCHLSGDLFGWEALRDGRFLIWIVDMAGHGIRAGLCSAVLKILIERTRERSQLSRFLAALNRSLHDCRRDAYAALFATGFFLVLDARGDGAYASAGHPPMLVRRASERVESLDSLSSPIGLLPAAEFASRPLRLEPGDALLLYTDGLVETKSRDGSEFGLERTRSLFRAPFDAPEEMTGRIYHEIATRQDLERLEDDVTFLVARFG